jgi:hypothetical protein
MKRIVIATFVFALVAWTSSPAWAAEGWLITCPLSSSCPKPGLTPPWIYVWKSSDALDEGQALLLARADRRLLTPLVACRVETGTRAVSSHESDGMLWVVVLEGLWKGCQGVIDGRDWK